MESQQIIQQTINFLVGIGNISINTQMLLTIAFDIVFYSFSTLFIFQFLLGLSLLMQGIESFPVPQQTEQRTEANMPESQVLKDTAISQETGINQTTHQNKNVEENTEAEAVQPMSAQEAKQLTFDEVADVFASKGLIFQRSRSGHHRYKVIPAVGSLRRFERLQDALDWLSSERLQLSEVTPVTAMADIWVS